MEEKDWNVLGKMYTLESMKPKAESKYQTAFPLYTRDDMPVIYRPSFYVSIDIAFVRGSIYRLPKRLRKAKSNSLLDARIEQKTPRPNKTISQQQEIKTTGSTHPQTVLLRNDSGKEAQ